ncbi:MAG: hypothetical protein RBJ76_10510 [Stenomitos frigidus ULC029]
MHRRKSHTNSVKYMLAGGSVAAAFGLLADPRALLPTPAPTQAVCQEVVQSKAVLSREQLSRLLAVPERSNKTQVSQIVKEPYCKLASIEVRAGISSRREAYRLAFDSQTWLVVLYEGDEYAGYDFTFRR